MHITVFLTLLILISCFPYHYGFTFYGRSASAYSTDVIIRCFSGDSFIESSNGKRKSISSLKSGDKIKTIDETNIISTEMILMLDKQHEKEALFYTLKTKLGHQISLTEYHLIPIKSLNKDFHYKFAKEITKGDLLYILLNNQIKLSPVINVTIEIKKGYYSPLTMKGTLLVNQILASSFAHVKDHHLAQFYVFPLRFYYKLTQLIYLNDPFFNNNSQGLYWIISILFHLTRYFRPHTLFF